MDRETRRLATYLMILVAMIAAGIYAMALSQKGAPPVKAAGSSKGEG
jgi:hypothetical protein